MNIKSPHILTSFENKNTEEVNKTLRVYDPFRTQRGIAKLANGFTSVTRRQGNVGRVSPGG
jgi:hypothetical protein